MCSAVGENVRLNGWETKDEVEGIRVGHETRTDFVDQWIKFLPCAERHDENFSGSHERWQRQDLEPS